MDDIWMIYGCRWMRIFAHQSSQASTFGRDGRESPAASVQSAETALDSVASSACHRQGLEELKPISQSDFKLTQFHNKHYMNI